MKLSLLSHEVPHPAQGQLSTFSEKSRAVLVTSVIHQGALFASIQALAAQALDGGTDSEQALMRIDILAKRAAADAEYLGNVIGLIPAQL